MNFLKKWYRAETHTQMTWFIATRQCYDLPFNRCASLVWRSGLTLKLSIDIEVQQTDVGFRVRHSKNCSFENNKECFYSSMVLYVTLPQFSWTMRLYVTLTQLSWTMLLYVTLPQLSWTMRLYVTLPQLSWTMRLYVTRPQLSWTMRLYVTMTQLSWAMRLYVTLPQLNWTMRLYVILPN